MPADLIQRRILRPFENVCAAFGTLAKIDDAFRDEGFSLAPSIDPDEISTRRGAFNAYTSGVDLANHDEARRLLRVLETITSWVEDGGGWGASANDTERVEHADRVAIRKALVRDGLLLTDEGSIEGLAPPRRAPGLPLDQLGDATAIEEHLLRLDQAADDDPALAISSAKALLEATCKLVLKELGEPYDDKSKVPALVREAQKALKVDPQSISPSAKGRETIVRTLSSLSQVAVGVAELRNEYGPDHGRAEPTTGLGPRHAHLAIGASQVFCRFLLETLRDRRLSDRSSR